MPNPYLTRNSKIPISGPKAYIDGGDGNRNPYIQKVEKARDYKKPDISRTPSRGGTMAEAIKEKRIRWGGGAETGQAQGTQSSVSSGYAPGGYTESDHYSTESPETMSYEEFYEKVGGNVYESDVRKAIDARVEQAVNEYGRQKQQAETSYKNAARQAYVNNMMSQRNMDQRLAANGIYGGMADSQRIAMDANYQNEASDLEQSYIETLADLDQAIENARLAGDAQAAEQMAGYRANVQSQYASYLMQKDQQAAIIAQQQQEREAAERASSGGGYSNGGGYYGGYDNGSLSPEQVAEMQDVLGVTPDGKWGSQSSAAANGKSADAAWEEYQAAKRKVGGYGGGGVGGGVNRMEIM